MSEYSQGVSGSNKMIWVGPFKFRDYLEAMNDHARNRGDYAIENLPRSPGIYLVTKEKWESRPNHRHAFYVGSTNDLAKRVSEFIGSMLGLYGHDRMQNPALGRPEALAELLQLQQGTVGSLFRMGHTLVHHLR